MPFWAYSVQICTTRVESSAEALVAVASSFMLALMYSTAR